MQDAFRHVHTGGLIFGMLTGLHTWGVYIREGLYMGGRGVLTAFYEMWKCLMKLNLLFFLLVS